MSEIVETETPIEERHADRVEFYFASGGVHEGVDEVRGTFLDVEKHVSPFALVAWDRDMADVQIKAPRVVFGEFKCLRFVRDAQGTWRAFHDEYDGFLARWDPTMKVNDDEYGDSGGWSREKTAPAAFAPRIEEKLDKLEDDTERPYVAWRNEDGQEVMRIDPAKNEMIVMLPCNKRRPSDWTCTRERDHEGACSSVPL